jgi:ubiquinone/menaquinone biosynthesis C-methylase UbiE
VSSYVIRGGAEGKARLAVLSQALEASTAAVLHAAGVREGMRCLDLGCGGGDVTLALARLVGPTGRVVGIDMDAVKIELARQDGRDDGVEHVEYRAGDAAALDARDEYDAVYARLLLTHLADPEATLQHMVAAVKRNGVVIVEDLDHSALFAYPPCPAVDRYVALYNEVARRRGGDPEIGPKLSGMLRRAGLDDVQLRLTQPVFMAGAPKRINQITLEAVQDAIVAAGITTTDEIDAITTELEAFTEDPDTIIAFPRFFQVFGRRPG